MIKVLCFGRIAEITGKTTIELTAANSEELVLQVQQSYPELSELTFAIAVNHALIHEKTALTSGDEVALLPPFSGG